MKQYTARRILSGLFATLVAVFVYGTAHVSAAPDVVRLYVTPASQSVISGNSVTVQVRLNKAANAKVDYAKADMTFSPSILEITSISRSGSHFSANAGPVTSFNNSTGTLSISGSGNTLSSNADVLIASVTFRAKAAGTGALSFTNASQAGDLVGSGSVKNELTATTGASVIVSPPPAPPATTQPKPSTPPPSPPRTSPPATQTPAPAPTPEVTAEPTPVVAPDRQPESSLASDSSGQPSNVATDSTASKGLSIERWQWILSGIISLGAIGGIVYILIAKKRKQTESLPEPAPGPSPISDDVNEPASTENEVSEPYTASPAEGTFTQDEIAPVQVLETAAVYTPTENVLATEPVSVDGVEIEPLDPAWPTRLNVTPSVESPLAADTQAIQAEPVTQVTQPEAPDVQPVYEPAVPVVEPPAPIEPLPAPPSTHIAAGADDFPDMFEEGAARLSAEGFDERLKPKRA